MSCGSGSSGGQKVDVTKEMENHAVQLMLNGQSPVDAMRDAGCNYETGSRDYGRVYKRFKRRKDRKEKRPTKKQKQLASQAERESTASKKRPTKKKDKTKQLASQAEKQLTASKKSQAEKELAAFKLMVEKQTGPEKAMIDAGFCFVCVKISLFTRLHHFFAGCNYSVGSSDYHRVYQRFWRTTRKAQQKATAAQAVQASRQLDLFKEKQESLQCFKHESNRALEEANRQVERCRLLEKNGGSGTGTKESKYEVSK